ncbi:MAG: hypothetical protein CVU56_15225, partial [Deltaproteobacteria bacterium HGW-Deltaproteobacteria-14]
MPADARLRPAVRGCLALVITVAALGAVGAGRARAAEITTANTVVNAYYALGSDAAAGATAIAVAATPSLVPGDVVLLHQAQGATIDTTNGEAHGAVTALNGAGHHELVRVLAVDGASVRLVTPLVNAYRASAGAQLVKVARYDALRVAAGASIVAPPWDGATGGIVAVLVAGDLVVDGAIDASARGFRGGVADNDTGYGCTSFRSSSDSNGATKGEGVAGPASAFSRPYARGALANGGGGGNCHNAAGGGGANQVGAAPYTGHGNPDPSYFAAFDLDPYFAVGDPTTLVSSGGGRGGYSYSEDPTLSLDPTIVPPGDDDW